jgi:hypothetical protein
MQQYNGGVQQEGYDCRKEDGREHRPADIKYEETNQNTGNGYSALGGLTPLGPGVLTPGGWHPFYSFGFIAERSKSAHQAGWFADSPVG